MKSLTSLVLALFVIALFSGCGKSLSQIKASSDKAIDAGVAAVDKASTEISHVASAAPAVANTVAGVAKEVISIGLALYQDVKDNYGIVKGLLGLK